MNNRTASDTSLARAFSNAAKQLCAALLALAAGSHGAGAITIDAMAPTLDKWIYPFAPSGGGPRVNASTFADFTTAGQFDNRDAQFFAGFDTGSSVTPGLGASNYSISSATFKVAFDFSAADVVVWDGTYDPIATYDANGGPVGDDAGRPIELYGANYRNGFTATTVTENQAFIPFGDPQLEGVRSIFATDNSGGTGRDVSNNVRDAFDAVPFAIGQVAPGDLNMDGKIKAFAEVTFTLNLPNPDVVSYLQQSLNAGRVNLIVSSLHQAVQFGPTVFPVFETKETVLGSAPRLQMEVTAVPEPSAALLALGGLAGLLFSRRKNGGTV